MIAFRYYIDKQSSLDMKELELLVEDELEKNYGKH